MARIAHDTHGDRTGPAAGEQPADVFVVGSLNADLLIGLSRRPRPGETVLATDVRERPGGKGANQAVAAARLGARVAMLGRVGDDADGAMLGQALRGDGVDTALVAVDEDAPTGRAIITITPDGENAIIVAQGANARLSADDVTAAGSAITAARVLVCQLEVPLAAVAAAVAAGGAAGAEVVLNLSPATRAADALLGDVGVLVVNEHEAGVLLQTTLDDPDSVAAHRGPLLALGPRAAVVTLGGAGAVVLGADGATEHLAAPRVTAVDTTGAGDAFVGALASELAAGRSLTDAAAFAVGAGACATLGEGAQSALPTRAEVVDLLRSDRRRSRPT